MLESFYRRGLHRFKQVEAGRTKIIEPTTPFVGIYPKLGIVTDPEIKNLHTVSTLACEEYCHCEDLEKRHREEYGQNEAWRKLKQELITLDAEAHAHGYYLQLALRKYFKMDTEGGEMLYLYAGWIASLCGPYDWAYDNTSYAPEFVWGRA